MEKKFESLTIFEFQRRFPDDNACMAYLADKKWEEGYACPKCGNTKYCK
ncbi:MAG: transposase, partial [Bacteroidales bacterium]|nr:transposase [Bacteroidales bacterium]